MAYLCTQNVFIDEIINSIMLLLFAIINVGSFY